MSATVAELPPEAESGEISLEITDRFRGRIVLSETDGTLWLGRNYDIYRSDDCGRTWDHTTSMPRDPLRWIANPSRLLCRLIRQEVRALLRTREGNLVGANRQGVWIAKPGERVMRRARVEHGDMALMPPMRISQGPGGEILWGEYGCPKEERPARLFVSRDGGESFEVIQTIGGILHIHNVVWDPHHGHYWVLTGDFDEEPGFARLSEDLQRFEWFVRGEQRYRAVEIFDMGDRLVYATDTQLEPNAVLSLDKSTGQVEHLQSVGGSCIYAARFGGLYALSTSVEPSAVNPGEHSELWLSRDGEQWKRAYRGRKDGWNADYLQFGSIVLPSGSTDRELVVFSGQALRGFDGQTLVGRVAADADF